MVWLEVYFDPQIGTRPLFLDSFFDIFINFIKVIKEKSWDFKQGRLSDGYVALSFWPPKLN